MAIILNDNIKINAGKPIDSKYLSTGNTAYISTGATNIAIPISERYTGLTVNVNGTEYWYKNGVSNSDLIEKKYENIIPITDFITGATNIGFFSGLTGIQTLPIDYLLDNNYDGNYNSLYNYFFRGTDQKIHVGTPSDGIAKRGYVKTTGQIKSWVWNEANDYDLGWIFIDGNVENQIGTLQPGVPYYNGTSTFPYTESGWTSGVAYNNGSDTAINTVLGSLTTGSTYYNGVGIYADEVNNILNFKTIVSKTPDLLKITFDEALIYLSGRTLNDTLGTITGGTNGIHAVGRNVLLGGVLTGSTFFNNYTLNYGGDYSTTYTLRSIPDVGYVNSIAKGLVPKPAVLVATTTSMLLSGLTTVDGIPLTSGDRILVKDQAFPSSSVSNGIYSASTGIWNRTNDVLVTGAYMWVLTGNTNMNTSWVLTTDPINVGISGLTFIAFDTVSTVAAGSGINVTLIGREYTVSLDGTTQSILSGAITGVTNGLTKYNGRNVCLGGALTNDVLINGNGYCFVISNCGCSQLNVLPTGVWIGSCPNGTCFSKICTTNTGGLGIIYSDINGSMCVGANCAGLCYCGNYASRFTARSLVDAGFVTGRTTGMGWSNLANGSTVAGCGTVASGATICRNTFYGVEAGKNISVGCGNIAVGYRSLYDNISGNNNIANGSQALFSNTIGCTNIANGFQTLFCNISGNSNTAIGYQALIFNIGGNNNIASGYQALYSNVYGNCNVANGYQVLYNNTIGSYNIANGVEALYCNVTGNSNVAVGYCAGYTETLSNRLHIANNANCSLIYGEFDNNLLKVCGCLRVSSIAAKTSEVALAYFKSDGTILSGHTSGSTGIGTITGATNGLSLYYGGRNIGLGGSILSGTTLTLVTGSSLSITDSRLGLNQIGITYSNDYSSNYVARSLVDAAYITGRSNTVNVYNQPVTASYTATTSSGYIGAQSGSTIYLPPIPKPCQKISIADISGNALDCMITIVGNGKCINDSPQAVINTNYGSVTMINNNLFWSTVAFIN